MAGQEVSSVMENITSELEKLNVQIESLENEIKDLEQKIDLVEKEYERQEHQGEKEHLRRKEEHLRKEKEQLRKEKEQLRKEKELLIQERIQLHSASGTAPEGGSSSQILAQGHAQNFWKSLRDCAKTELQILEQMDFVTPKGIDTGEKLHGKSGFLKLGAGAKWLQDVCVTGDTLYVRACYEHLWNILERDKTCGKKRWLVTGTPGIGKSGFLLYLLWMLKKGVAARIVFQSVKWQGRILFEGDKVVFGEPGNVAAFSRELWMEDTWWLVDGCDTRWSPFSCLAFTVLCQSPNDADCKEWLKTAVSTLCMPVWNFEELEELRVLNYSSVMTDKRMRELFGIWGGVPRIILEFSTEDESLIEKCKESVRSVEPESVIRSLSRPNMAKVITHKVMHLVPKKSLRGSGIPHFASDWMREHLVAQYDRHNVERARLFVLGHRGDSTFGVVSGHVFEMVAYAVLSQAGNQFQRKVLEDGNVQASVDFTSFPLVPGVPPVFLNQQRDRKRALALHKGMYVRAGGRGLDGIDALILPESKQEPANLFQITLDTRHNIKAHILGQYVTALKDAGYETVHLYFVYDEEAYSTAHRQQYVNTDGSCSQGALSRFQNVQQFALLIPLRQPLGSPPKSLSGGSKGRVVANAEEDHASEIESGSRKGQDSRKRKVT